MRSAMAMAMSRKVAPLSICTHRGGEQQSNSLKPQHGVKRRSIAVGTLAPPAVANHCSRWKRPRTSWGRPHADPSVLVCSLPFAQEEAATTASSNTSFVRRDEGNCSSSYVWTVPSPCEASSFVKIEPLQDMATIKTEDFENHNDLCLHHVPTYNAVDHLIFPCNAASISDDSEDHSLSARAPMIRPLTWKGSPCSHPMAVEELSGEHLSSSVTDEFSGHDPGEQLNWKEAFHEGACELLSERFYLIEEDMRCIMGESRHEQDLPDPIGEQHYSKPQTVKLNVMTAKNDARQDSQVVRSMELLLRRTHAQEAPNIMNCVAQHEQEAVVEVKVNVDDGSDCSALSSCGLEEEYRIDLEDFELSVEESSEQRRLQLEASVLSSRGEAGSSGDGLALMHTFKLVSDGRGGMENQMLAGIIFAGNHQRDAGPGHGHTADCNKVALSLNYETVLSAWRDRGSPSPFLCADASPSRNNYPLNLQAWQPGNLDQVSVSFEELVYPEASKMIMICSADDGTCVGDAVVSGGSPQPTGTTTERHARVLRYREKRRTRLFSKTIRYEVRKLNAERRPRMKGRFIKRSMDS